MPRIKRDSHGLYLRVDGSVFRPELARYCEGYVVLSFGSSNLAEGDLVKARHLSQTMLCKVRFGDDVVVETWFSHGSYLDDALRTIRSDDVWSPCVRVR